MTRHAWLLALASVGGAGCSQFHHAAPALRPFVPPPVAVRTTPLPVLVVSEPPPNPDLYLEVEAIPFPPYSTIELPDRPPLPPPRPRQATVQPAPVETPEPVVPPPVPVPKLTRILSADEERTFTAQLDESTRSAEQILQAAARVRLGQSQLEMTRQVRSLIDQARSQKDADLVVARNLGLRAMILARELQRTLR